MPTFYVIMMASAPVSSRQPRSMRPRRLESGPVAAAVGGALDRSAHGGVADACIAEDDLRRDRRGLRVLRGEGVPARAAIRRLSRVRWGHDLQPARGCHEDDVDAVLGSRADVAPGRATVGRPERVGLPVPSALTNCAHEKDRAEGLHPPGADHEAGVLRGESWRVGYRSRT